MTEYTQCPKCLRETLHYTDHTCVSVFCDSCGVYLNIKTTLDEINSIVNSLKPKEFVDKSMNRKQRRKLKHDQR